MSKTLTIFLSLLKLISTGMFMGCGLDDNNSVSVSSVDGSVKVVKYFLINNYLRDPDSYKSREWGKLIKNSDGSFQISHRFSANNGLGGVNTETLHFCITSDGKEVNICSDDDLRRIERVEIKAKASKEYEEYIKSDFSQNLFKGTLTENIDGIDETSTLIGKLSKINDQIIGTLEAIEKEAHYSLTGKINSNGNVIFNLENQSNRKVVNMSGYTNPKEISAQSIDHKISFFCEK